VDGHLAGKVAIVTGAGSITDRRRSMGPVMAAALHQAGALVAGLDVNGEGLGRLAAELNPASGPKRFLSLVTDISDADQCEAAIQTVRRELGPPDILVNLAGISQVIAAPKAGPKRQFRFWEADPVAWQKIQAVHSTGPFLLARLVVPDMLGRGWGRIINISSSFETMLDIYRSAYGPSKAALEASSAIWAKELEGTGVTVNCLLPGGMVASNSPGLIDAPEEKMLSPSIMAAPVCWLASPASDGINGRRFVARLWDERLTGDENAKRQTDVIGWRGVGPGRTESVPGF
jgi:NAD(P)-dependent dehydrogenase (short-subunit alcohol dehydrogenase family)